MTVEVTVWHGSEHRYSSNSWPRTDIKSLSPSHSPFDNYHHNFCWRQHSGNVQIKTMLQLPIFTRRSRANLLLFALLPAGTLVRLFSTPSDHAYNTFCHARFCWLFTFLLLLCTLCWSATSTNTPLPSHAFYHSLDVFLGSLSPYSISSGCQSHPILRLNYCFFLWFNGWACFLDRRPPVIVAG